VTTNKMLKVLNKEGFWVTFCAGTKHCVVSAKRPGDCRPADDEGDWMGRGNTVREALISLMTRLHCNNLIELPT
jgi:hypothetical protein